MIDLNLTLLIVDGVTERLSFNKKFKRLYNKAPDIRVVPCNGRDVSPQGYVNAAYGVFRLAMRSHYRHIICVFDRERRPESAATVADNIKNEIIRKFKEEDIYREIELNNKISICVPDIMFENWIVSDVEGIKNNKQLIQKDAVQEQFDGKSGVNILKNMMKERYRKTIHGPVLFELIRFPESKNNSQSFKNFCDAIKY